MSRESAPLPSTIDAAGVADTMAGTADTIAPARFAVGSGVRVPADPPDYTELVALDRPHYVLGTELARGGMGRIRLARDRRLGRTVAVKELLVPSAELAARFEREVRITAKLQHPAIVNLLEAGRWLDGVPFYAMKLVEGESLAKVIASGDSFEQRISLLPHVIAVVDALGYAHARGVIHRDLKPSNVLVGEFGETVVIDWGLAKEVGDTDAPIGAAGDAGDALETVAGSVMGTPAYMPPEQAAGETVDARADVYALGAILYHVLAGEPPYTGTTSDELIRAVRAAPPISLAERAPDAPHDLIAIVEKAMARAPHERYASARELGSDLRRFQTGQLVGAYRYSPWHLVRRWLRRYRLALGIAALAAVVLGVFGILSVRRIVVAEQIAETQRAAAERQRDELEDIIAFDLRDLGGKLQAFGKVPLLDDVAEKALSYFERNPPVSLRQQRERALALSLVGDVRYQQNDVQGALRAHLAAAALLAIVPVMTPGGSNLLAREHGRIGDVLRVQGDLEGAARQYRVALADAELAARDGDAGHRRDLAVVLLQLGELVAARGDAHGALALLDRARSTTEQLLAAAPEQEDYLKDAWSEHSAIGDARQRLGDLAGAAGEQRAALELADRLAARDPSSGEPLHDRSVSNDRLAELARLTGDVPGAVTRYRAGLAIAETLAARDPSNSYLQRDVAVSHATIARALQDLGDPGGASRELDTALVITGKLAASDPKNTIWQRDLAFLHISRGELLRAHDADAALHELRMATTELAALLATSPDDAVAVRMSYNALDDLGAVLASRHDWPAAVDAHRRSVAAAQHALALARDDLRARRDLADAYETLCDTEDGAGDRSAAIAACSALVALRAAVVLANPGDPDDAHDLADARVKLARSR